MNSRVILQDLAKAVAQLEKAVAAPAESDVVRAGCIQYFEFCFELSWKTIRAVAMEHGLPECTSPKSCLRLAFSNHWVDDETVWLEMLMARNRMAHTYDIHGALDVYGSLQEKYLPQFKSLLAKLQALS